ncbi:MAG: ATP-binding protein [Candidatus Omnitrophica bacterium]|nr:ATP-binding protein [Candidatus Omnitrophota bacterium]
MTLITNKINNNQKKDKLKYAEKLLRREVGRAINAYDLISPGDKICIGISGGEDSLILLHLLSSRMLTEALKYSVIAVYVKTDLSPDTEEDINKLKKIAQGYGVKFYKRKASVVKSNKKKKIDCFWCSWNKRKQLFSIAKEKGCNKIALGHHKDDIVQTTLMNLFFNGIIATINPKQEMFKGTMHIIRPLVFLEKQDLSLFSKMMKFQLDFPECALADKSKRLFTENIIGTLVKENPVIKANIFRAPTRVKEDYLGKVSE